VINSEPDRRVRHAFEGNHFERRCDHLRNHNAFCRFLFKNPNADRTLNNLDAVAASISLSQKRGDDRVGSEELRIKLRSDGGEFEQLNVSLGIAYECNEWRRR